MNDLNLTSPPRSASLKATHHKLSLYLSDLDETEQKAIHQDWRYRLLQFSEKLATSPRRSDWFFHQLMQEHDLMGLVALVNEFNSLQLNDALKENYQNENLDVFHMDIQSTGLFLTKKSYTHIPLGTPHLNPSITEGLGISS